MAATVTTVVMETMVDSIARLITTHAVDTVTMVMTKVTVATRAVEAVAATKAVVVAITKVMVDIRVAEVVAATRDVVATRTTTTEAAVEVKTITVPQVTPLLMPNAKSSRKRSARNVRRCEQSTTPIS